MENSKPPIRKGRGALSNPEGRFESRRIEPVDDGWELAEQTNAIREDSSETNNADELPPLPTTVLPEPARSIITRNNSPDIPFDQSINPYRGCEHGCIYCMRGDTAILLADGRSKLLADIAVGDEIFGTDERSGDRRYVRTRVLVHWKTHKPSYRVRLSNGASLDASADHRFLTDRGWRFVSLNEHDPEGSVSLAPGSRLVGIGANITRGESIEGDVATSFDGMDVVAVEPLSKHMELFDITTGTGDFIANGVISHNCFARPTHSYVNLSPGLDFETKLFYKQDAAKLLEKELRKPSYRCKPINLGASTDPYQPIERKLNVTRSILEVLAQFRHPVTIVTKGHLVTRDIDILSDLAKDDLVGVYVSITTLDPALKRGLEPRAPSPAARLQAVQHLSNAGIPVGVLMAPIIPVVNDHEIERVLEAVVRSGGQWAGHVMLRLPYEVKDLFREWLQAHMPLRADHVMSLVRQMRGGRDNDPNFGSRMRGEGAYAQLISRRFEAAARRLGLNQTRRPELPTDRFRVPPPTTGQLSLL